MPGVIALFGAFMIMIIILAVLALIVVKALAGSPWGTFTVAATIPVALFMGVYRAHPPGPHRRDLGDRLRARAGHAGRGFSPYSVIFRVGFRAAFSRCHRETRAPVTSRPPTGPAPAPWCGPPPRRRTRVAADALSTPSSGRFYVAPLTARGDAGSQTRPPPRTSPRATTPIPLAPPAPESGRAPTPKHGPVAPAWPHILHQVVGGRGRMMALLVPLRGYLFEALFILTAVDLRARAPGASCCRTCWAPSCRPCMEAHRVAARQPDRHRPVRGGLGLLPVPGRGGSAGRHQHAVAAVRHRQPDAGRGGAAAGHVVLFEMSSGLAIADC